MKVSKLFMLGILLNAWLCICYRILVIFPLPVMSHAILGDSMVKHLLEAGHEVTYITPFTNTEVHPKLHVLDISDNVKTLIDYKVNIKRIMNKEVDMQDKNSIEGIMIKLSLGLMELPTVQEIIHDPNQNYDVVIAEYLFSDIFSVLGAIFDCPFIWFSTIEPHWMILNLIDGPSNPAYTNDFLSKHIPPLSFRERIYELWVQMDGFVRKKLLSYFPNMWKESKVRTNKKPGKDETIPMNYRPMSLLPCLGKIFKRIINTRLCNFDFYYREEKIYQHFIVPALKKRGKPVPSYDKLIFNTSLILGNNYVTMGDAIAMPPNFIEIGGYHIDEVLKPLPEDLKNILDNAKHGVIYFSLGSNVKGKDLPVEIKRGLLEVFKGLKQTVIWKLEEELSYVPKNVHIVQWAPQQSILAHQNTILFVTHGGLLSLAEAVYYSVPVVVVPLFLDQFANALRVEKKGFGIKVEVSYRIHEDLKIAIQKALRNPNYSNKVKEISLLYRDRPLSAKQELLFWINHVIRTKGARYLRSPALEMPLYQRLFLDLIAVILLSIYVLKSIASYILHLFSVRGLRKKEKRL